MGCDDDVDDVDDVDDDDEVMVRLKTRKAGK